MCLLYCGRHITSSPSQRHILSGYRTTSDGVGRVMVVPVVVLLLEAGKGVGNVESSARARASHGGVAGRVLVLCVVGITADSSAGETESWSGHCCRISDNKDMITFNTDWGGNGNGNGNR